MKFDRLLELTQSDPVFEPSDFLLDPADLPAFRVQLSRWVKAGKIIQVRRGLYYLNEPWRKGPVPGWSRLCGRYAPSSWVTEATALSYYGVIPDVAFNSISHAPAYYPDVLIPKEGLLMQFSKVPRRFAFGCKAVAMYDEAAPPVLLAEPEKALLDWAQIHPHGLNPHWLQELRLDYELLDEDRLLAYADGFRTAKAEQFALRVAKRIREEKEWAGRHIAPSTGKAA